MTTFDQAEIRAALAGADIRVLLMVLFHLTGDRRWLQPPFHPERDIRLFADISAGLSEELQQQVRDAVLEQLLAGVTTPQIGQPDDDLLVEMMSLFSGEHVAKEYVPLVLEEMRFAPRDTVAEIKPAPNAPRDFRVLIIGAGMSGLCAAIKLQQLGIAYTVIEKNTDVGGTWLENNYPDCRVDTPNHFYSFSFAPNHDWSRYFSPRDELYQYFRGCADQFKLRPHIRFNTQVEAATWDEAAQHWQVTVRSGDTVEQQHANIVISAVGQLNRPQWPRIEGMDSFGGELFHSARWPEQTDLRGKRVAVIGTGASAMQLVPRVAEQAAQLTVFQRSPQWARPSPDYHRAVSPGTRWLLYNLPLYAAWYRFGLFWRFSDSLHRSLHIDPEWPHPERSLNKRNDRHRIELTEYIESELNHDAELIAKCLPDYPPFGKRILVDNGWFKTLLRDNVELVTEPIAKITAQGIELENKRALAFDVIIIATGFQASGMLGDMQISGREGRTLAQQWGDDDPRAYLGMSAPGFPNLFFLYGPNTNLGHGGSIIFQAECQVRYILGCIAQMLEQGASSIECRDDKHDEYNAKVDAAHAQMIWTHPGMATYYRNSAGRVVTNSPWRLVDYWNMTHTPDFADYHVRAVVSK
jgi:4-hydroxyacetophenone monooxygenase